MSVDIRKPLDTLRREWKDCQKCTLGERRVNVQGSFVFGEGVTGGIMFIGEGPGREEETYGRPFIGESGQLLRTILATMKVEQPLGYEGGRVAHIPQLTNCYISNLVACRSCVPQLDEKLQQRFFYPRKGPPIPLYKDEPPLPSYINVCRDRLNEEIFLVDPVVIVTLGAEAATILKGQKVAITNEHGQTFTTSVPGGMHVPVFTEKRRAWLRTVGGTSTLPTKANEVDYLVVPALHPAYVLRKRHDEGERSPMRQLIADVWHGVKIYERYMNEGFGVESPFQQLADNFDYATPVEGP